MPNRRAVLMAAVFSLGLAASAHAETLADAVALAYQSNPTLLVQRSLVKSADEAYLRARRGLDPTLSANQPERDEQHQSCPVHPVPDAEPLHGPGVGRAQPSRDADHL
jgi:outer membrane protein TolC